MKEFLRDLSTNIWEYYFNQNLANNSNIEACHKLIQAIIGEAKTLNEEKQLA